jgi:hypothetical protein
VCRPAYGGVVHSEIVPNRADQDFPRVQPDPDLQWDTFRSADLLGVSLDHLLHPERRVAGPHSVVFVRDGCAEEGHDPIAHHLVDRAFVAVNGLHHVLNDGIEQPACLFGVAVGEQLHRALQVGEENRDLLALALQRGLGRQNPLGKVSGSVGRGGRRASRGWGRLPREGYSLPAPLAELRGWLVARAAGSTWDLDASAALLAEGSIVGVLVAAPRAPHGVYSIT